MSWLAIESTKTLVWPSENPATVVQACQKTTTKAPVLPDPRMATDWTKFDINVFFIVSSHVSTAD